MIARVARRSVIVLVMLIACGGLPAAAAGGTSVAGKAVPKELEGLRERWESAMRDIGVPGLAVVVVRGDEVIYVETLGLRDPQKDLPVTPDTMFYIASCTKSYTAMGVLSLVEQGKVDLDGPVKTYLPRMELPDAALTSALTCRDLLSHSKGVDCDPIVTLDAYTGEITEDRYYRWLREAKIKGSYQYSNVHYTLAGRVIESVSGKPWRDFLEERIFKPAGMLRTTGYASRMYGDSDCAIPSAMKDGKFVLATTRKTDRVMHAAGGLGASIDDLGRWLRLNLNRGEIDGKRIVSKDTIAQMQLTQAKGEARSRLAGRSREGYGLGWFAGAYQGRRLLDHGGGYEGTSASVSFMPSEKIGVAAVANAGGPLPELVAIDVYNRLLHLDTPADPLPSIREQAAQRRTREKEQTAKLGPNPAVGDGLSNPPEAYVGTYVNPDWGTLLIALEKGELTGRFGELPFRLVSTGRNQFEVHTGVGDPDPARFEVEGAQAKAIVLKMPDDAGREARFERP